MSEITESDIIRARRLRDEGASWKLIGKAINHDPGAIHAHFDPIFRAKRNQQLKENRERLAAERLDIGKARTQRQVKHHRLPDLAADRDRRLASPATLDNILTRTPIKGRSALDGWKQRGIEEVTRNGRPQNISVARKPWTPLLEGKAQEAAE